MRPACLESCPLAPLTLAHRPAAVLPARSRARLRHSPRSRGRSLTSDAGPGPSVAVPAGHGCHTRPRDHHRPPRPGELACSSLSRRDRRPGAAAAPVPASAAALPAAETRVGASGPATTVVVGVHECITAGQRPVRGPSQPQVASGNCVAANAGTRSGLPRDALGRFTSGAGGESAAAAAGRTAHANYANTLGGGNYVFNRALPGSRLRPDAVDYSQNIVRELKPGTPSGISRGWRQVNEYKAYLEDLTGQPWTAQVDVYTP